MKTLFEYLNYRDYLSDYYSEKSAEGKLSLRSFARRAELGSPSYLKYVIDGKRNLTEKTIPKFTKALGHKKDEAEFFRNLVLMNQSSNHEDKNRYYHNLARSKRYIEVKHLEHNQFKLLSKWHYAAIREMVLIPNFIEDPELIGRSLRPHVSADEVSHTIELLLEIGLLIRDKTGKLKQSESTFTTGSEVAHLASCNYHLEMLKRASESMFHSAQEDRHISGVTIAMSKNTFDEVKKRIAEFSREICSIVEDSEDADAVYQVNFQLFSLNEDQA